METVEAVKESCKRFFRDSMKPRLQSNLYLWFNQPCIYKCSTLDDFFTVINYKENAAQFTWYDFDYYVYMYYLILYHDFKIEDIEIESNYGICEASLDWLWFKSNKYEKINIWMCSQVTLSRFDNPNLFIVCHLDRDEGWMLRVTNMKLDALTHQVRNLQNLLENKEKECADLYARTNDLYRCRDDLYKRTDDLYRRLDDISLHISAVENQNALMQKSVSWHLGRAITFIPRKLISLGAGKRL